MSKLVVFQPTKQPSISLLPSSLSDFSGTKLCQFQYKRKVWQPKGALHVAAASTKKILVMGGTRFIGIFLSRLLVKEGHQVTLFTRGKAPITQQLPGEPDSEYSDFKSKTDAVDAKSRHKGKLNTENLLASRGVNWTSLRPVYIYGPLNYNPVEEWFFHRLKAGRPIPIPNSGVQITQLGHVKDLAKAFIQVLGNEKASKQAAGFPEPEIVHFNPKEFDFGKKKAFPFRDQASLDRNFVHITSRKVPQIN
ncbi:NAD-dependent epimerase/dehydratase - like 10 [Theobroma cacao]|nr:NAD-dependent epimerase/dehydratase - like 10 [Theobroma cacao]